MDMKISGDDLNADKLQISELSAILSLNNDFNPDICDDFSYALLIFADFSGDCIVFTNRFYQRAATNGSSLLYALSYNKNLIKTIDIYK